MMVINELGNEVGSARAVRRVDHKRFVLVVLLKDVPEFSVEANLQSPKIGFKTGRGSGLGYDLVNSLRLVHEHYLSALLNVLHVMSLLFHFWINYFQRKLHLK